MASACGRRSALAGGFGIKRRVSCFALSTATVHDEPGWRFVLSCYPCRLWDLAQFSDGDIETNRRVWENGWEGIGDLSHNGRWALSRDGRTLLDAQWGQLLRTFTV